MKRSIHRAGSVAQIVEPLHVGKYGLVVAKVVFLVILGSFPWNFPREVRTRWYRDYDNTMLSLLSCPILGQWWFTLSTLSPRAQRA
jgi:hypothetical protein